MADVRDGTWKMALRVGMQMSWFKGVRHPVFLALAICLGSAVSKLILLEPVGPIVFFDELLYMQGAKALAGLQAYPSGQYPFGYPVALASAIALGWGYDGIYLTNVALSSLLPLAVWLLAGAVAPSRRLLAALLSCLLPFHYLYPTQVMAENLYLPLFVMCTWYAVRGRYDGMLASACFGGALAFTFLVKYIALPGIFLLWIFWLFTLLMDVRKRVDLVPSFVCSGTAAVLLVGIWLAYADSNGIGVREAFGGNVSGLKAKDLITLRSVAMWFILYMAAIVLLCGPYLGVIIQHSFAGISRWIAPRSWTPMERLVLLFLMLAAGYALVCVQHSAGAAMNYPVPQRIIVRYLMHLTPLAVVIGICGAGIGSIKERVVAGVLSCALVYGAWFLLYGSNVFGLPHWFADIPLYAADIMIFKSQAVAVWMAVMALVLPLLGGGPGLVMGGAVIAAGLMLGGQALLAQSKTQTSILPMHAKALVPLLMDAASEGRRVRVYSDLKGIPTIELRLALAFWGVPGRSFEVVGGRQMSIARNIDEGLRITATPLQEREPVARYRFGSKTGYIYSEDAWRQGGLVESERYPVAEVEFVAEDLCNAGRPVSGTLSWDFQDAGPRTIEIYVRQKEGGERLFAAAQQSGAQTTGPWVNPGTHFIFRSGATGELLSSYVAGRDCRVGNSDGNKQALIEMGD